MKVLKYLRRTVPDSIPQSSMVALERLPSDVLASLRSSSDLDAVINDKRLKDWLTKNPIPAAGPTVSEPLFDGTLVFAQVSFAIPDLPPSGITAADTQTAIDYATLAVQPIQRYAAQYGPNSVSVWPVAIPYTARLQGNSFDDAEFEGWVDNIAQFMREQQVSNPCIVIMHNRGLPNSPTFTNERDSFHLMTGSGTPYCYSLVFDENLSIADNNHTAGNKPNENVYAHALSHEIAEMVVDPRGDDRNPEVCDACSGNCNVSFFDLFDQNGVFIGGTTDIGSAPSYSFFISSIVRSDVALDSNFCVAQGGDVQSACIYPPPPSWNHADLTGSIGAPAAAGDPAGYTWDVDSTEHVVYRGTDSHIHELWFNGAWNHADLTGSIGAPAAAGDPAGYTWDVDSTEHVVYRGTDSHIHELWFTLP
jgi:hypothetical protein